MNVKKFSLWRDPHCRELVVAAAAGAVWALVGVALAAHGANGSCRIQNYLPGAANVGSGTLIDVTADRTRGLVLSCAHLFTEGQGRIVVEFPDGRRHGANLVAIDRHADLSALEIAEPPIAPASIGTGVDRDATLTACGFGPSGAYRCVAGQIVGTSASTGQENLQIAGAVRSGDSGGGVFDPSGRLVGVAWGEAGGVTYASTGRPLQAFLNRVLGSRRNGTVATGASPPVAAGQMLVANCPTGTCPLIRPLAPNSFGIAPAGRSPTAGGGSSTAIGNAATACPCNCNGACGTQLAAIASRIDALDAAKQDRGNYADAAALAPLARAEQLATIERQSRERESALIGRLESRLESLDPLVGAAGRAALPVVLPALGISGPLGWGVLAAASIGSALITRQFSRRRATLAATQQRSAPQRDPSPPIAREATRSATADLRVAANRDKKQTAAGMEPQTSDGAVPQESPLGDGTFRGALHIETRAPIERDDREARELLRLSQLEGRDPLQDALAGRLALDRLDAVADGDADPQRAQLADELRRELRERFNEIAPTKFQVPIPSS
jgi:hypothetical protein